MDMVRARYSTSAKDVTKIGDKIVLNYLYDRALIVAPNYRPL